MATPTYGLLARFFVEAATKLHAQSKPEEKALWTASVTCEVAAAAGAGVCLFGANDRTSWVVAGPEGNAFEELGDPRLRAELLPALSDGRQAQLHGAEVKRLLPRVDWEWVVAVRLARPGDTPKGVLMVGGRGAQPEGFGLLDTLAVHAAVALDNHEDRIQLQASNRQIVHRLSDALSPPPFPLPHTDLGRAWAGADTQETTGGDLHDWLMLPDGRLHFCIVDVMGKGVAATKDAVAVTHVIRLLVLDGCPLQSVISRADSILTLQNPDLVATALVGSYDPETGRVDLAGGGHPPPLLVSTDGVEQIEAPGIPIGWPGAGSAGTISFTVKPGCSLLLYTDGLIEGQRDVLAGLDQLATNALQTVEYPADYQAKVLIERSKTQATRQDDSLALVIRRRHASDAPMAALGPFRHVFGASLASIPLARHLLQDWLEAQPIKAADKYDLLLTASELCANAQRHTDSDDWSAVLSGRSEGRDIIIEVQDSDRTPIDLSSLRDEPDLDALSGRGLFLIGTMMELDVEYTATGKTVRARRRDALTG